MLMTTLLLIVIAFLLAAILQAIRSAKEPLSAYDQLTPAQQKRVDERLKEIERENEESRKELQGLTEEEYARRVKELEAMFNRK